MCFYSVNMAVFIALLDTFQERSTITVLIQITHKFEFDSFYNNFIDLHQIDILCEIFN